MDIDKVRELTDAELAEELNKQRRHLYDLRFQLATRQLTDYSQLTQTRRTIARLLTVATEREATGAGPIVAAPKATTPRRTTREAAPKVTATGAPRRSAPRSSEKKAETASRGKK